MDVWQQAAYEAANRNNNEAAYEQLRREDDRINIDDVRCGPAHDDGPADWSDLS
jgi:hypothetical protein